MERYDPKAIEAKWQRVWAEQRSFSVPNPVPGEEASPKHFYMLEMLPYPSGVLHMGHVLNYTMGDVMTHFRRRSGFEVLRPMGYDSFGLPAENAAIKEGGHPREIIERNIANIGRQMRRLGWAIDWDREVSAHEPEYYRWTQWLFVRFFEAGLAYQAEAPVNWCPNDQTVLANEQVIDGRCERCGAEVEAKNLEQWFFRITAYADELRSYEEVESWPERTKTIQRNWIGRSEGAELLFHVPDLDLDIPVFTTRPDTVFGATFFVLAPEHPLVPRLTEGTLQQDEVETYVKHTLAARTEERLAAEVKTGVFTGRYAINPATGEPIPIWVADYVLMAYGTGAIMGVPAHDERDYDFAQTFGLPIVTVVEPADGREDTAGAFVAHSEGERLVNSAQFSGMPAPEGLTAIVEWLGSMGKGRPAVSFRLRDWGFSRQRYWGCPIPIVHCGECGPVPVPDDQLPVLLPEVTDYRPRGKPPLASNEEWMNVPCPRCGTPGRREADTMDTFVDSSWYFLRYCDPHNDTAPWDCAIVDYWCPVDQYIGGIDHATGHLLYSRFFVKVLNDLGLVGFREPFARLLHQGWVQFDGTKMSKSKGNVIGPDELVETYGADAVRLYILSDTPPEQDRAWTEEGIEGVARFVRRLWRVVQAAASLPVGGEDATTPLARKTHETIAKVSADIERFHFHTAISAVRVLVNELDDAQEDPAARFAAKTVVSLIQPYAPHVTAELWERLGHERPIWEEPWPIADPALLERETFQLVVQVNGRVRDRLEVEAGLPDDELVERAKASPRVQAHVDGQPIRDAIVVPGRLVNLVV
jgi:leucyl-tRNA synthetase